MASEDNHNDEDRWNSRVSELAHDLARHSVDYSDWPRSIARMNASMNTLMTELWDAGFSQGEIRSAYATAIDALPGYAAGEERNGVRTGSGKRF